MTNVTWVNWADDWSALYIDGRKVWQGHSLYEGHLLEMLDKHGLIDYTAGPSWEDDDCPWSLEDGDDPPELLTDIGKSGA